MSAHLLSLQVAKKICFLAAFAALSANSAEADCTYRQKLKAEEFEIGVTLEWKTSAENNNLLFEIEKSVDGRHFVRIGSVDGAGNTFNTVSYRFLDAASKNGVNTYRLRQVDSDGSVNISEAIRVERRSVGEFAVMQLNSNLCKNMFSCTVDSGKDAELKIIVQDALGETLRKSAKSVQPGLNNIDVDLCDLPEGPYKIVLKQNKEEKTFAVWKAAQEPDEKTNIAMVKKP